MMDIVKHIDVTNKDVDEMRNKLKLFGIDISLDSSPTLTIGINTKENYQQLFRVLKRLTINSNISLPFAKGLLQILIEWKKDISSGGEDLKELSVSDKNKVSDILEFKKRKIDPNISIIKGTTLLTIYEGSAYRQRRIYIGEMKNSISLPSGQKMKKIVLISKEVVIFLNWLEVHFPFGKEDKSWKSIYRGRTDQTYFGVICHFIINKFDHMNAQYHREPLDEVFNQFYLDYMVSYSGVMQRRVDEKLRSESVATAYLTKKNIPEDILDHMEGTRLLKLFDYVEFDEDIDLDKIKTFEKDALFFKNDPFFRHRVSSLRIRKLGKHSSKYKTTSGLYYPSLDNISIDLEGLSSFVHEWGHSVDSYFGRLSTKDEEFLEDIHLEVVKYLHKNAKLESKQIQYYSMPSEVFARAFEWYINDKYKPIINTSLKAYDDYLTNEEYKVFNEIGTTIKGFFSKLENSIGVEIA